MADTAEKEIDYLTEDPPIPGQLWACLSILSPTFVKNCTIHGIKIRGVYPNREEADKRAKYLQETDPKHNVFVGEVGKWLPFDDDPEKAEDHEYKEQELNKIMKAYNENQIKAKMLHEQRKNEMIQKNLEEQMKLKKKNKKKNKKKKRFKKPQVALNLNRGQVKEEPVKEIEYLEPDEEKIKEEQAAQEIQEEFKERGEEVKAEQTKINEERKELLEQKKGLAEQYHEIENIDDELKRAQELYQKLTGEELPVDDDDNDDDDDDDE